MYILSGYLVLDILIIIGAVLLATAFYFKHCYNYWAVRGIPYIKPEFPYRNVKQMFIRKQCYAEFLQEIYNNFKSTGHSFVGYYVYTVPYLLLIDPELIKNILTKDFSSFSNRGFIVNEEKEPITGHIAALSGNKWRTMRQKLTPTFTSGKIKLMFKTMLASADALESILIQSVQNKEAIEVKDLFGRYTADIIVSCAFGLDSNSIKNSQSEFTKFGTNYFIGSTFRTFKKHFVRAFPNLFYFLNLKQIDNNITDFFTQVITKTIRYREENNVQRNDFLQLLINIKNTGDVDGIKSNGSINERGLSIDEIISQCYLFFLAGFETSATAMTYFIYHMAVHQDVQDRVREEIRNVLKKNNGLTYDGIMEMKYLDMALSESMRLYPGIPDFVRVCTKDYKIPGYDVTIDKGTFVCISLLSLHSDPEYFPQPRKYDPERFSPERKEEFPTYSYLPFGEGPRNCLGQRFGSLQTKIGLVTLLKNHKYTLNKKTQIPLQMNINTMMLTPKGGIWMDIECV